MRVDSGDFFREVTLRVSSSLDIEEALGNVLSYLGRYIPIDTIGLHRVDMERMRIFAVAEVTRNAAEKTCTGSQPAFPIDPDLLMRIRESQSDDRRIMIHNNPRTLPASVLQCFPHLGRQSVISMRLRIKQEELGGLVLSCEGHGRYTDDHAALLESVKDPIALAMSNAWRYHELKRLRDRLVEDNRALSMDVERVSGVQVVGADFGLSQVMDMVRRVAPMSSPVLLLGETGTGKEVIANAIHLSSPRNQGPLIRVQCGAIPETLLDSELFGHERGAFTGAIERKRGRFERAAGGTIFLDEIGELTADAQVKLLRVLQERQFERVGGAETLTADVRVIAATHRDLAQMVREGHFREDLWYRLNVFPIHIPPLRMRRGDIRPLVHFFVERKAREMNLGRIPMISAEDLARLHEYDWPGNVRELQNVIERAIILSRGSQLVFSPLGLSAPPPESEPPAPKAAAGGTLDEVVAAHIQRTLEQTGGRLAGRDGAAERLRINPSTLRSRMKRLGIRMTRVVADAP